MKYEEQLAELIPKLVGLIPKIERVILLIEGSPEDPGSGFVVRMDRLEQNEEWRQKREEADAHAATDRIVEDRRYQRRMRGAIIAGIILMLAGWMIPAAINYKLLTDFEHVQVVRDSQPDHPGGP